MEGRYKEAPKECPCGKGHFTQGSGLYGYYSCGHAFQKPLGDEKFGKIITFNPFGKRR